MLLASAALYGLAFVSVSAWLRSQRRQVLALAAGLEPSIDTSTGKGETGRYVAAAFGAWGWPPAAPPPWKGPLPDAAR